VPRPRPARGPGPLARPPPLGHAFGPSVTKPAPKTIHFRSLGCAKNRVDTEVMLGVGDDRGFQLVDDPSEAQVIVVNTCGFIGPAKEESIDTILEMGRYKESGQCEQLVVAGCLSQRYAADLVNDMPEVDHFLGSSDMLKLGEVLDGGAARMLVGNPADWTLRATDPRRLSLSGHSAYIKIAEGCNRICSFCAIPGIRGKQRSRPIADVVSEVKRLVSMGLVEANLVSQDTVSYGRDLEGKPTLAQLVAALGEIEGLRWIRLHYLYPETLTNELVDLLGSHPKVLPYIDMPLQHASDAMLRRMKRGHGGDRLYRVVEKLRARVPNMVFRTTFIVGHPGETEADFAALMDFVKLGRVRSRGRIYVFPRRRHRERRHGRPRTREDDPRAPPQAHEPPAPISRKKLRALKGQEIEVLVDGVSDESEFLLEGRWWGQAQEVDGKVYLANGEARPGDIVRAVVENAADYDLVARAVSSDDEVSKGGEIDAPKKPRRAVRLPTVA
jgi:ribosomal protein S12 methylthiotransferase